MKIQINRLKKGIWGEEIEDRREKGEDRIQKREYRREEIKEGR